MTDWSVVGEIIGETNLDDVGDRIERAMEEASDAMQEAAGSAQAAEDGMEDAAKAAGALAGSANKAEDEVEELGDELNEVTLEAQTASGSVAQLSATMQTVESGGFGDLADDLNQASRTMERGFEEGLDDFIGEPAMSLDPEEVFADKGTRGSFLDAMGLEGENLLAGRLALTEALGGEFDDMEHFGRVLNDVTDQSVEINDIIGGYSEAFDEAADSAEKLSKELPDLDDTRFRSRLIEGLEPEEGKRAGFGGRIKGMLTQGDFEESGGLARALSRRSDVATAPADVLQAVEDAMDAPEQAMRDMEMPDIGRESMFADLISERLEPADRKRAGFGGRIKGFLQQTDFADAGELTDALTDRADVDMDSDEVLRAVEESLVEAELMFDDLGENIDEDTFEMPETVAGEAGRRIGVAEQPLGDAFDEDSAVLSGLGRGRIKRGPEAPDAPLGPAERDVEREFVDVQDIDIESRGRLIDMDQAGFDDLLDPVRKEVNLSADEFEDFRNTTDKATDSTSRLRRAMDRVGERTRPARERIRGRLGGARDRIMGGRTGQIMDMRTGDSRRAVSKLDVDLDELSRTAHKTNTSLGFVMSSMALFTGQAKTADAAVDDLDDEVEDLSRSLAVLGSGFENLSANLGPFNISLSNLLITIPILLGILGPLLAVVAGLASAFIAVGAAFASLLAVGALGFSEKLQNNFADINSHAEAFQAILKGLKDSIMEALQPLRDVEFAGLGPSGIFVTFLQDIVTLIGMFAEAMAALLEMEVVEDFLLRLRAAVLGFSEETEGGLTMIEGLKELMKGALPILGDFLVWLIDVTPEFLAFVGMITQEAGPAIASLAQAFLRLAVLLTEVGSGAFTVLLPALALVLEVATFFIGILVTLERELGLIADVFFAVASAGVFTAIALAKMVAVFESALIFSIKVSKGMQLLNSALVGLNSTMLTTSKRVALVAGRFLLVLAGIYLILDALGWLEPVMEGINDILEPIASGFESVSFGMGLSEGAAEDLINALKFLTGAFILASYAGSKLFAVSMAQAAATMVKFAGGAIVTSIALLSAMATELIIATGGLWGLISAETTAIIVEKGFAGATWSVVSSLTALQVVTGLAIIGLIAFGAALATGLIELEQIPVVGEDVAEIVGKIGELFGVSAETAEAATGAVIALTGAMWAYTGSAKAAALWTGRLMKVLIFLAIAIEGLNLATGQKELEEYGAVGRWVASGLEWLANAFNSIPIINTETSKDQLESLLGTITSIIGALGFLHVILGMFTNISVFGYLVAGAKWLGAAIAGLGATTASIIAIVAVAAAIFTDWALNMEETVNKFQRVFDILGQKIAETEGLVRFFWILVASLATVFIKPFQELFELILNPKKTLGDWADWFMAGIDAIIGALEGIWNWAAGGVNDFINDALTWLGNKVDQFIALLEEGYDTVTGQGGSGVGSRTAKAAGINSLFKSDGSGVDLTFGQDIPFVASGGFVESEGLAMVHPDEFVIPKDRIGEAAANIQTGFEPSQLGRNVSGFGGARQAQQGGGDTNVTVNVSTGDGGMDDRDARRIANITRQTMQQRRRTEQGR